MECKTSSVNGVVSKADDVIIHPKATVRAADNASITIGDGCIIEELCVIEAAEGCHMEIGKGNLFQVGSRVRASVIGDFNVFGVKSEAEHGVRVGSGCELGSGTRVASGEQIEDGVVVFRNGASGEQATGVAPRALEEHRVNLENYRLSLVATNSRFMREHEPLRGGTS